MVEERNSPVEERNFPVVEERNSPVEEPKIEVLPVEEKPKSHEVDIH